MEKNIHKFITHVVNNLFPLNEYSDAEIKRLMIQFKQEADDLNIEISDKELEASIKRFGDLQNSPKIVEKDLRKYNLAKLLKITGSSEGADVEAEMGPDVIYSENGYTIYSGESEELCQRHRDEVPWCITKSAFGNYRYSADRGFPSFYLIKNINLPIDNALSFVAIQVRNDGNYVYTNRKNNPNESPKMGWEKLNSEISWLQNIPNVKSLLRHIPLSTKEKLTQLYSRSPISIRKWETFSFNEKKQYLVVRKGKDIFSDISDNEFIEKHLPNYPQLATFVATNAGVINSVLLLKHLDKFSVNDRKSITANLRNLVSIDELDVAVLPFEIKKLLVKLDKWGLEYNERIYVTKNNEAIVKLTFEGNKVKVGVYTEERDYPDIKLNSRTAKFLLDYPDLDELPLPTILNLIDQEIINADFVNQILIKAQQSPKSAIIVKDTDTGKIVLDSNSFSSYKVENGKLTPISFDDEEVKNILKGETENSSFQNSAVELVFNKTNLPSTIDKNSFLSILNNTPYDKRTRTDDGNSLTILVNQQSTTGKPIFVVRNDMFVTSDKFDYGRSSNWYNYDTNNNFYLEDYKIYIKYLKAINKTFTDNDIKTYLANIKSNEIAKAIVNEGIPMAAGSTLFPAVIGNTVLLVNRTAPGNSFIISDKSGKLISKAVTSSQARQILGITTPTPQAQAPQAQAPQDAGNQVRRGRPAGGAGPIAPAVTEPGAISTAEVMAANGLQQGWNTLPNSVRTRLSNATTTPLGSRGASRRNNLLGNRGRVNRQLDAGASSIYFIRLTSGTFVASINTQPGNGNWLVTPTTAISMSSPSELVLKLQNANLNESERDIMLAEFIASNPTMIDETKKILRYYKNKFKNPQIQENMKINKLKQIIKEELRAILAEKSPEVAPAPTKPKTKEEEEKKKKNPLHPNPDTNPKTRPKAKANEAVSKGIADIVKRYKLLKKK